MARNTTQRNLDGLRGWLILLGIVLILMPIRALQLFVSGYRDLITSGDWLSLLNRWDEGYNLSLALASMFEIGYLLSTMGLYIYLLYLFGQKRATFPSRWIIINAVLLCLGIMNMNISGAAAPESAITPEGQSVVIIPPLMGLVIWSAYLLRSKRVEQTFRH